MREILFRGKRKDTGEWVYGCFGQHTSLDAFIIDRPYPTAAGDWSALGFFEVEPNTVGQYTGLSDKNGKRIFEGDVVAQSWYDHDEPIDDIFGEVVYCTRDCSFSVLNTEKKAMEQLGQCNAFYWEIEVIGNIHDNPELLEGGTSV